MQLRICIAADRGLGGHRPKVAANIIEEKKFYWPTMDTDLCLLGEILLCTFSVCNEWLGSTTARTAEWRTKSRQYSTFRFSVHPGFWHKARVRTKQVFFLFGFVWLCLCNKRIACTSVTLLMEYFTSFVSIPKRFSDQKFCFFYKIIGMLAFNHGLRHNFSTCYAP